MTMTACGCCGGDRPRDPDAWDQYLTLRETAMCTGNLAVDETGRVVGCGAWGADAYREEAQS